MPTLVYVAVKLISYIAWCWFGLRFWRVGSASLIKAAGLGALRLAIGIIFGVSIFLAGPISAEHLVWKYIAIYVPVRAVEWLIMAWIIGRKSENQTPLKLVTWCLGGIVVSFVADFASPEGIAGHFCVDRCLC
jgi:hypothetical protein